MAAILNCLWPANMVFLNFSENFFTWLSNVLYGLKLTAIKIRRKMFKKDVIKGLKLQINRVTFEPEGTALIGK